MNNEPAGTRLAGHSYCVLPWGEARAGTRQLIQDNSSCGYTSRLVEVAKDVGKGQEHKAWVGKFIKSFFQTKQRLEKHSLHSKSSLQTGKPH